MLPSYLLEQWVVISLGFSGTIERIKGGARWCRNGMKVRGDLETLVSTLRPVEHVKASTNEIQQALMNSDLLSREVESISRLLIGGGFLCLILYIAVVDSDSNKFSE
ncbi:hypothetical protein OROHE_004734 [Orobanche hederae]